MGAFESIRGCFRTGEAVGAGGALDESAVQKLQQTLTAVAPILLGFFVFSSGELLKLA